MTTSRITAVLVKHQCGHNTEYRSRQSGDSKGIVCDAPLPCHQCEQESSALYCVACHRGHRPEETVITPFGAIGRRCLEEREN